MFRHAWACPKPPLQASIEYPESIVEQDLARHFTPVAARFRGVRAKSEMSVAQHSILAGAHQPRIATMQYSYMVLLRMHLMQQSDRVEALNVPPRM